MKLKPVMSANLPIRLYRAFTLPPLNTWYIQGVAVGCLHATDVNPAGHYIQYPDLSVAWENGECGVEVSFSKLSATFARSGADFERARVRIEEKFVEIIGENLPLGRSCWTFVGSQTDLPVQGPDGKISTLLERGYVQVKGLATPDPKLDQSIGDFCLKPMMAALSL